MSDAGQQIVDAARGWIGTRFRWEASLKPSAEGPGGCDCRGLVAGAARDAGRPEASSIEASLVGYAGRIREATLLQGLDRLFDRVEYAGGQLLLAARPGDVLAIRLKRKIQHLAIYAGSESGEHRMIHAYLGDPARVCEVPIVDYWQRRIAGLWRWKPLPEVTS